MTLAVPSSATGHSVSNNRLAAAIPIAVGGPRTPESEFAAEVPVPGAGCFLERLRKGRRDEPSMAAVTWTLKQLKRFTCAMEKPRKRKRPIRSVSTVAMRRLRLECAQPPESGKAYERRLIQ
jgi:hypothetical protein